MTTTEDLSGTYYHVFSDNYDYFYIDKGNALKDYRQLVQDGKNARLYLEVTNTDGDLVEESCLESDGDFPL